MGDDDGSETGNEASGDFPQVSGGSDKGASVQQKLLNPELQQNIRKPPTLLIRYGQQILSISDKGPTKRLSSATYGIKYLGQK